MKTRIKRSILAVLHACDGVPMPETALLAAVQCYMRPEPPSDGDVADALMDIEHQRYAAAVTDELTGERTWTLTPKGTHKAREARGA
jgi:hypothetical protein